MARLTVKIPSLTNGGSLGFCGDRKRAILGAEMRKSIIVSAECRQCTYLGPLRIAEITNFCLQICRNRGKNCGNAELHTPSDPPGEIQFFCKRINLLASFHPELIQQMMAESKWQEDILVYNIIIIIIIIKQCKSILLFLSSQY